MMGKKTASQDQDLRTALEPDHEFKSHPDVFWPAARGEKTFEFRKDDRLGGYHVGQTVRLRCYDPDHGYYGHPPLDRRITNILRGGEFGLQPGYCILSLAALSPPRPGHAGGNTAPDKAGAREGVETWGVEDTGDNVWVGPMRPDGVKVARIVYGQDLRGYRREYADRVRADARLICDSVNAALAPTPTGAEAGRGVDAEVLRDALVKVDHWLLHYPAVLAGVGEVRRVILDALAATPTPPVSPSPDSMAPAGAEYRVGRKVRRNVYRGDQPVFMAATESEAVWLVALLNAGQSALHRSVPIAAPVREDGAREALKLAAAALNKWSGYSSYPVTIENEELNNLRECAKIVKTHLASLPAPASAVPGEATSQEGGR